MNGRDVRVRLYVGALALGAVVAACSSFSPSEPVVPVDAGTSETSIVDGGTDAVDGADSATMAACSGAGASPASLYIVGGQQAVDSEPPEIWRASICNDGALGEWTSSAGALNFTVVSPAAALVGGFLVVSGGQHSAGGVNQRDRAYTAALAADGTVAPFVASDLGTTAVNRWRAAFAAKDNVLFVVGGEALPQPSGGPDVLNRVDAIIVDDAGHASALQQESLGELMSSFAAVVRGDRVLTFGGSPNARMYAAAITSPSTISSWAQMPGVYDDRANGAVLHGEDVYLVGGYNRPRGITRVTFDDAGTPTVQETKDVLPRDTALAGIATYNGVLYVTGGSGNGRSVYQVRLSPGVAVADFRNDSMLPGSREGHVLLAF